MSYLVTKLKDLLHSITGTDAGHAVEAFVVTEAQKAVAVLKQTHIGAAVAKAIEDVEAKGVPIAQRMENVVADVSPLLITYLLNKGQRDIDANEVRSTMLELGQSIFNDVKSTSAGQIAAAVLK